MFVEVLKCVSAPNQQTGACELSIAARYIISKDSQLLKNSVAIFNSAKPHTVLYHICCTVRMIKKPRNT